MFDRSHNKLDEAVFAAYGWKSDLSNKEILEKLPVPAPFATLRALRVCYARSAALHLERSKSS